MQKISFSLCTLILYYYAFNSFTLSAAPQELSCWKKSPTATGRIIIFHDNHLSYADKSRELCNSFSRKINNYDQLENKEQLTIFTENPFQAEHGSFMKMLAADTKTDTLFLMRIDELFNQQKNKISSAVTYRSIESRNLIHIIPSWLTANRKLLLPNGAGYTPQNLALIEKSYKIIEHTTLQDIYRSSLDECSSYVSLAQGKYKPLFIALKNKIEEEIFFMKKTFSQLGITENSPIVDIFCKTQLVQKTTALAQIIYSGPWMLFLDPIIETRALFHLMQLPEEQSALFIIGFDHARELEKMLFEIGYSCETRKKLTNEEEISRSFDLILPAQKKSTPNTSHDTTQQNRTCIFCSKKSESLLRCSGCKLVYYCNQSCQRSHWKEHKINCGQERCLKPA